MCTALCLDRAHVSIVPVYLALEAAGGAFLIISPAPLSLDGLFLKASTPH